MELKLKNKERRGPDSEKKKEVF